MPTKSPLQPHVIFEFSDDKNHSFLDNKGSQATIEPLDVEEHDQPPQAPQIIQPQSNVISPQGVRQNCQFLK